MTEVTDADRVAAAENTLSHGMKLDDWRVLKNGIIAGKADDYYLCAAFARHRLQERAAIVAWLRRRARKRAALANSIKDSPAMRDMYFRDAAELRILADAIERGEHIGAADGKQA